MKHDGGDETGLVMEEGYKWGGWERERARERDMDDKGWS